MGCLRHHQYLWDKTGQPELHVWHSQCQNSVGVVSDRSWTRLTPRDINERLDPVNTLRYIVTTFT
jgi:hypothetical protein